MSRKTVDLEKVKAARKTLKEIASEHPGLLGERGPENVKGWETILAENEMGKNSMVAFRLENELLKRIDAYAKQVEEQNPGLKLARVDAVRMLLVRALDAVEQAQASAKKRQ